MTDRLVDGREPRVGPKDRSTVELHARPALAASREFVFRRSSEFSSAEKEQFRTLFDRVFGKALTAEQFDRKYCRTPLGYSHHGLMLVDGRVVGAYNLVPYRYECFGRHQLFALSVDAMVDQAHRSGPFHLVRMARLVYEEARRDGVVFAFGFPNDQAYTFTRRILKWAYVGDLDFYALPIRIGAFRSSLAWADQLSRLFGAGFVRVPRLRRPRGSRSSIEKVCDEAFQQHRYDERHGIIHLKHGGHCVYRAYEEDNGVRVFYIIDVAPLTRAHFGEAVRESYRLAASCADLMLYVGRLPFRPRGLLRLPPSKHPRPIRMCGKILNSQHADERVLCIQHWNVNISNFDVR